MKMLFVNSDTKREKAPKNGVRISRLWRALAEEVFVQGIISSIHEKFVKIIFWSIRFRHRQPSYTNNCSNNIKLSFVPLFPTQDLHDLKVSTSNIFSWEWTMQLKLPFFEGAEPYEAENSLNHVYAGTMARTISQVGGHPIDTIKTRLQVRDPPKQLAKWKTKILESSISMGPIGFDNWLLKGPADLYLGVTGAILGTLPNAFLYFVSYESSKRKLSTWLPPGVVHMASASIGTIVASIVRVPADTLKHKVQAYMHENVFEALRFVVQSEGIGGLYRGFWPTLLRDIPEIAIQFGVYERMRTLAESKRKFRKLTTPEHLLIGAFSGALAAAFTMPLDLVKTQQQCGLHESVPKMVFTVVKEKGASGLFAGLILKPNRTAADSMYFAKIWHKRREKIWERQFIYIE